MLLAEGPVCCAGTIALLIVILGVVAMIAGLGQGNEYTDEEEYDYSEEY
jgi:hypothetical protein